LRCAVAPLREKSPSHLPPLSRERTSTNSRSRSKLMMINTGIRIKTIEPSTTPTLAQMRCWVSLGSGTLRNASHPKMIAKIGFSSPSRLTKQNIPNTSETVANAYFCPSIRACLFSISLMLFLQYQFGIYSERIFSKNEEQRSEDNQGRQPDGPSRVCFR